MERHVARAADGMTLIKMSAAAQVITSSNGLTNRRKMLLS
jgi:hypothetical protein